MLQHKGRTSDPRDRSTPNTKSPPLTRLEARVASILGITMAVWVGLRRTAGPEPKVSIGLNRRERNNLLKLVRKTQSAQPRLVFRARIILMSEYRWGLANKKIASLLEVRPETVRKWRRRFNDRRLKGLRDGQCEPDPIANLNDAARKGARRTVNPIVEMTIIQLVTENKAENRERRKHDIPVQRLSTKDLHNVLQDWFGELAPALSTIYRILKRLDLRPWLNKSWLHIRDFRFFEKASVVLDLMHGMFEGQPLGEGDHVLCSDECCQLQVVERVFRTAARRGQIERYDFEYKRHGTITLHAARDIRTGKIYWRFPRRSTKAEFRKLVLMVMKQEPFRSAKRVFWILDNGPCHHPNTFGPWLDEVWPGKAIAVHTPVHASWLNQIEVFFSVMVRKALTPRDFAGKKIMKDAMIDWLNYYNENESKPFNWAYTKEKLEELIEHLKEDGCLPVPTIDNIPGVGDVRKQALLARFGEAERVRMASIDQIAKVHGFGPKLAKLTWLHLHS